jgi:two-component system, OmpR family, response regulator RpaA
MCKPSILIVDDEPDLVWALQRSLSFAGYEVLTCGDGQQALDIARRHSPALVVLDIVMPGMNGLEVCRHMRHDPLLADIPIIFLTKRSACTDRVLGLNEGGDDYLSKPFDLQEFKARIQALLRRSQHLKQEKAGRMSDEPQQMIGDARLAAGAIVLNTQARLVCVAGRAAELTSAEFDLLYFLMSHPGCVYTSQELVQQIWNYPAESANPGLVRWHMKNLRAKIETDPQHPVYLRTVARQGYKLECLNAI